MQINRTASESSANDTVQALSGSTAGSLLYEQPSVLAGAASQLQHSEQASPAGMRLDAFDAGLAQHTLQVAPVPMLVLDTAGKIMFWNQAASRIFGWTDVEVVGHPPPLLPAEHANIVQTLFRDLVLDNSTTALETTLHKKNGARMDAMLVAAPLHDSQLTLCGIIITIMDMTRRNKLERKLATERAVTLLLTQAQPRAITIPQLLKLIGESLEWGIGLFWEVDHTIDVLRCTGSWHAPGSNARKLIAFSHRQPLQSGVGLPGRVWLTGKPAWIGGVVKDDRMPRMQLVAQAGFHGAYVFPVGYQSTLLGVLEFFSRKSRRPSDDLLQMFDLVGRQLGQYFTYQQTTPASTT